MGGYEYVPGRSFGGLGVRVGVQIYEGKKLGRQEGFPHRKKKEARRNLEKEIRLEDLENF